MKPPRYAGWGPRAGAAMLDALMVFSIWLVLVIAGSIASLILGFGGLGAVSLLLLFVSGCLYYGATMTRAGDRNGQTLGKQASGLRVVRDDGRPVTLKTVATREVLLKGIVWYATFGVCWIIVQLWPLGEREKRSLHDLAVRTHVIDLAPPPKPQLAWTPAPPRLAPPLARHVYVAREIQVRIAQVDGPELAHDIDAIVRSLQACALRAQLLYDALVETPVATIERRLEQLRGSGKTDLLDALREQLIVQRRMQAQLERYLDELERVVVELDTIRGHLVSIRASTGIEGRLRLAEAVRELRDETSALAAGASHAYG